MAGLIPLLAEHGVSVIPTHETRGLGQTHAGATLARLLRQHGEAHLRDVLAVLTETENNRNALVAPVISGVSRVLIGRPHWFERDASTFLQVVDRVDLAFLHQRAKAARRVAPPAQGVGVLLHEQLAFAFGERDDLFDPRGVA